VKFCPSVAEAAPTKGQTVQAKKDLAQLKNIKSTK